MRRVLIVLMLPFLLVPWYFKWLARRSKRWDGTLPLPERDHVWYKVPLAGCVCSEGSPYYAFFKRGTCPDKLVFYFAGGGVSWSEKTADASHFWRRLFAGKLNYYTARVSPYVEVGFDGILKAKSETNPFDGWNVVFMPYATGDFYMGNGDFPYTARDGSKQVVHHHGQRNLDALLALAAKVFPETETILVTGESAGAFGCVAQAPRVVRAFPKVAHVAICSDGAQLHCPAWKSIARDVWHADASFVDAIDPDKPGFSEKPGLFGSGLSGDDAGALIRNLFERARKELGDDVVYLHANTTHDEILCLVENMINHDKSDVKPPAPAEFNAHLKADTAALVAEIPNYRYYITDFKRDPKKGTTPHTFLREPARFTNKAMEGGVTLAQWLDDAVNHGKLYNVGERHFEQ